MSEDNAQLNEWNRCADGNPSREDWYWVHIKDTRIVKPGYWYDGHWVSLSVPSGNHALQAVILDNVEHWVPMEEDSGDVADEH